MGTSSGRNQVLVGFLDTESVWAGGAAITSMGIPADAIIPELWGAMSS